MHMKQYQKNVYFYLCCLLVSQVYSEEPPCGVDYEFDTTTNLCTACVAGAISLGGVTSCSCKNGTSSLYSDIKIIYGGDAFRGFFDFAVEHRIRTEAAKLQLPKLNKRSMANTEHMLKLACKSRRQEQPKKDKTAMQKEQEQQCYRLKSQQEYRMLREQKQEERWLLEKIN